MVGMSTLILIFSTRLVDFIYNTTVVGIAMINSDIIFIVPQFSLPNLPNTPNGPFFP